MNVDKRNCWRCINPGRVPTNGAQRLAMCDDCQAARVMEILRRCGKPASETIEPGGEWR